jgi:hypothetical protein
MTGGRVALWSAAAVVIGSVAAALVIKSRVKSAISSTGVILTQDADARRPLPIPNVEITASNGASIAAGRSAFRGFFRLNLPGGVWRTAIVVLKFRHPDFRPLDISNSLNEHIFVVRMVPAGNRNAVHQTSPESTMTDVRVRYGVKTTTTMNVGSTVRTFEVANVGNVPCDGHSPCSPDGKWKATIGAMTLAAGGGHEFRNARISCIAGPCPFTRVESDGFSRGGGRINATVRNWSDTVTFLLEADVTRTMVNDASARHTRRFSAEH